MSQLTISLVLLALSGQQATSDVVGGYRSKFEDGSSAIAAAFGKELLRISPDGKFNLFRFEIEGTWVRAGSTLVLTPTKVMGQSPATLRASLAARTEEAGNEVKSLIDLLVGAFTLPFNLEVKPDGTLHQGMSLRSLEPFDWVRDKEPPLLDQLTEMGKHDDDFDMALYAYYFVGIQDNAARLTPELIAILDSEADWNARDWAAIMLMHSKSPEVVPALMRHVENDHRVVRAGAERSLAHIGDKGVLPRLIELNEKGVTRYGTITELIMKAKAVEYVPFLVAGLDREKDYDRQYALEALAAMPKEGELTPEALQKVYGLVASDANVSVRANAAIVVAKWSGSADERERAFQVLVSHLDTPDWLDRISVVEGVAQFGFRAVRHLIPMLKDSEGPIRRNAAEALGNIGAPVALTGLREAFKVEDDAQTREAMFEAIRKLEELDNEEVRSGRP